MKNIYEELPKLKVELSLVKVLVIIITLTLSLIIPAEAITYFRDYKPKQDAIAAAAAKQQTTQGKVAGISTSKTEQVSNSIDLNLLGKNLELSKESGVLVGTGLAVTAASLIILIVLILNDKIKYV